MPTWYGKLGAANGAWQVVFSTHKLMYVFYETPISVVEKSDQGM